MRLELEMCVNCLVGDRIKPLQEQQVLLTAEPSLQLPVFKFKICIFCSVCLGIHMLITCVDVRGKLSFFSFYVGLGDQALFSGLAANAFTTEPSLLALRSLMNILNAVSVNNPSSK